MKIDDLRAVLSPPPLPVETHGRKWSVVEQEIGTRLPDDYKMFIEQYGSGRINSFIWIFNPFSSNQYINLNYKIINQLEVLKTLAQDFGEKCPYPLFPQSGGLLPFGETDNGDAIYWLTRGDPNAWQVVVNQARGPKYEEFALNTTNFLAGILTHKVNCTVFPKSLQEIDAHFEPAHDAGTGKA
jgi:hypothetical protein